MILVGINQVAFSAAATAAVTIPANQSNSTESPLGHNNAISPSAPLASSNL